MSGLWPRNVGFGESVNHRPRPVSVRAILSALAGVAMLIGLVWILPARAETELKLVDGRVLTGTDLRRDGENYVLRLESGEQITLPMALVESVGLIGSKPPPLQNPPPPEAPGIRVAEPETIAGYQPDTPGIRSEGPEQLAGDPVRAPTTSEQLSVFGEPSRFQKGVIDPNWQPETDWNMDPETQNNFAPSTWSEDVIDPNWQPESAYDYDKDVLEDSRSTFGKGVIDNSWQPTDGFKK